MNNESFSAGGDQPELSAELRRFAAELSRLRPREDRLDRERLAFLAGQASMVSAPSRSGKTFGGRLEGRAWPAAFAVMSALAATLLFLLVARPEATTLPEIATSNTIPQRDNAPAQPLAGSRNVLTTLDVRFRDLETYLAKLEAKQKVSKSSLPAEDRAVPVYTPSAWRQVINDSDSFRPLFRKSSNVSRKQGINT